MKRPVKFERVTMFPAIRARIFMFALIPLALSERKFSAERTKQGEKRKDNLTTLQDRRRPAQKIPDE